MTETVTVVIPHFQRHSGVLARTLAAVFRQNWGLPSRVIIVDDTSPAPAADELADLEAAHRDRIQIIERPNGGPARARNTGLDAAANKTDFIALSDCDDIWPEWHLNDAITAMRLGYDFFFGDHIREGESASQFVKFPIDQSRHLLLDAERQLYGWRGRVFDAFLRTPVVGLSTVVFRESRLGGLRFSDKVGLADDLLYAANVASVAPIVAFSRRIQAVYGLADNLSVIRDWRSNKSLFSIASLARYDAEVLVTAPLDAVQRLFVVGRLKRARHDFAFTLLAMMKARTSIDKALVQGFLHDQPATLLHIPSAALAFLAQRISRLPH